MSSHLTQLTVCRDANEVVAEHQHSNSFVVAFVLQQGEVKGIQNEIDMIKADAAAEKIIVQAIVDKVNSLTPVSALHEP